MHAWAPSGEAVGCAGRSMRQRSSAVSGFFFMGPRGRAKGAILTELESSFETDGSGHETERHETHLPVGRPAPPRGPAFRGRAHGARQCPRLLPGKAHAA